MDHLYEGGATIKVIAKTDQGHLKDISKQAREIFFDDLKEQDIPIGSTVETTLREGIYVDDYYGQLLDLANDDIAYTERHREVRTDEEALRRILEYPFIVPILGKSEIGTVRLSFTKLALTDKYRYVRIRVGDEISVKTLIIDFKNFGLERVISLYQEMPVDIKRVTYIAPNYQLITGVLSARQILMGLGMKRLSPRPVPGLGVRRLILSPTMVRAALKNVQRIIRLADRMADPHVRLYMESNRDAVQAAIDISIVYGGPLVYRGPWEAASPKQEAENKKVQALIKVLERFEKATNIKFHGHTMLALLFSVEGTRFAPIYRHIRLFGIDDEYDAFIRQRESEQKAVEKAVTVNKAVNADRAKLQLLQNITDKKFPAKFNAIMEDFKNAKKKSSLSETYLGVLSGRDRDIIIGEYDKIQLYWDATNTNKCPHIAILREFDRLRLSDAKMGDIYENLKKFFVVPLSSGGETWIKCSNCDFRLMCPHLKLQTELTLTGTLYRDITRALTPFYDNTLYDVESRSRGGRSTESGLQLDRSCKICGEIIIPADEIFGPDDAEDERASGDTDLLGRMIYGETMSALATIIPAGNSRIVLNKSYIAENVKSTIYSDIAAIEEAYRKIKTDTEVVIEDKVRLQAVIFIYAVLVNFVNNPANKLEMISVEEVSAKSRDPTKIALANLKANKTRLISRITATIRTGQKIDDMINANFATTIKKISQKGKIVIKESTPELEAKNAAKYDPYHDMLLRYGGPFPLTLPDHDKKDKKEDSHSKRKTVPNVFFDMYQKSPILVGIGAGTGTAKHIPSSAAYDKWLESPTPNITDAIYSGYVGRGVRAFIDYRQKGYFKEPAYVGVSSELSEMYDGNGDNVTFEYNGILRQFFEDDNHVALRKGEAIIYWNKLWWRMPNASSWIPEELVNSGEKIDVRMFDKKVVPLALSYGKDGHRHRWDIFVICDETSDETRDIPKKDLSATYLSGVGRPSLKYVTRKCSVCGITRDAAEEGKVGYGDVEVLAGLQGIEDEYNLLIFYESRCPVVVGDKAGADTHEMDDGGVCIKCKKGSMNSTQYYETYKDRYFSERANLEADAKEVTKVIRDTTQKTKKCQEFEDNYNYVINLARELKVNVNLLSSIGFQERVDYDYVKRGELTSEVFEGEGNLNGLDNRIARLESYARLFVINFNRLIYARVSAPSAAIKDLYSQFKVDPITVYEKRNELSELVADFAETLEQWKFCLDRATYARAIIQKISYMAIQILETAAGIGDKKLASLLRGFVEWCFGVIIRSEELDAKYYRTFSWKIFNDDINLSDDIGEKDIDDRNDVFEDIAAEEAAEENELDDPDQPKPFEEVYQMDNTSEENVPNSELE